MCVCGEGGAGSLCSAATRRKVAKGNTAGLHESSFQRFGYMCLTFSLP